MAECDYCGRAFDDEEALLAHMRDEHDGELSRIDRRRVGELDGGDGDGLPTGPIAIGFIIFASAAVVAFVIFGGGGGSNAAPADVGQTPYGTAHEHGIMEVEILGEPVDFSQRQYQVADSDFHFENGNGRVWHTHAEGVTIEYALSTLGIEVNGSAVTFEGTTYEDGPEYDVNVTVDGEAVDPSTYVLEGGSAENPEQGDHVQVVVERNESA